MKGQSRTKIGALKTQAPEKICEHLYCKNASGVKFDQGLPTCFCSLATDCPYLSYSITDQKEAWELQTSVTKEIQMCYCTQELCAAASHSMHLYCIVYCICNGRVRYDSLKWICRKVFSLRWCLDVYILVRNDLNTLNLASTGSSRKPRAFNRSRKIKKKRM